MRNGRARFHLEVDLSRGLIMRTETDSEDAELFLGGQGTAAKMLWERVPPEVSPSSEDNLLVFSAGLLDGTPVPGANRTSVSTIDLHTNGYVHAGLGGFFGPELKYAGYDAVVIRGKSPTFVYLWIKDDRVEVRDASHLVGKSAREAEAILRRELKDANVQVAAIGRAGENRVFQASIEHANAACSRGVGAVMGDKGLKAIAVRGTGDLHVAEPDSLFELCSRQYGAISENASCGEVFLHPEDPSWHVAEFLARNHAQGARGYWDPEIRQRWQVEVETEHVHQQWENYSQTMEEEVEVVTERSRTLRGTGCYNCWKDCHQVVVLPGQRRYFMKSYCRLVYAMAAPGGIAFDHLSLLEMQEHGLDEASTASTAEFAIQLYEAGVLTEEDLPDFPPGGAERLRYLAERIARREGIGDALADGVAGAARRIGRGAAQHAAKRVEPGSAAPAVDDRPHVLMAAAGDKTHITQIEGSFPPFPIPDRQEREAFVAGWEAAPERFRRWLLEWEPGQQLSPEAAAHVVDWSEAMHTLDDALGLCPLLSSFRGQFGGRPPYHLHNLAPFVSRSTGIACDGPSLLKTASRIRQLVRAIHVARGRARPDHPLPKAPWGEDRPQPEAEVWDRYCELRGWSPEGVPLPATLEALDLHEVRDDLRRRLLPGD